jgi:Cytotoxic
VVLGAATATEEQSTRAAPARLVRSVALIFALAVLALAALAASAAPALGQTAYPPYGPIPPGTQIIISIGLDGWTTDFPTPSDCDEEGNPTRLHLGGLNAEDDIGAVFIEALHAPEAEGVYWNVPNPPSAITLPPIELNPGFESAENVAVSASVSEQCQFIPGADHWAAVRTGTIDFCCWSVVRGAPPPPPGTPAAPGTPGTPTSPGAQPGQQPICNPTRGIKPPGCTPSGITKKKSMLEQFRDFTMEQLEFWILEDLRKLGDPNVSDAEKALIIASYFVPVPGGFILKKLGQQILKKLGPRFIAALEKAASRLAQACSLAAPARAGGPPVTTARDCGKQVKKQVQETIADSVTKSNSPIWRGAPFLDSKGKQIQLEPHKGPIKTNGKTGKKAEYYEWDHTHNDIEVYDKNYQHKHVIDPVLGTVKEGPVKGRELDERWRRGPVAKPPAAPALASPNAP